MGANIQKNNSITSNRLNFVECEICGQELNNSELDIHLREHKMKTAYRSPKFKKRNKFTSLKHNTPNFSLKAVSKVEMINAEDLVGCQYSPEVLEETYKQEINFKQHEEVNKNVKEFCLYTGASYNEIPFDTKLYVLKGNLNKLKIDWREGCSTLIINRDKVLNESIEQFNEINHFKELKINFIGEVSIDAGGLIREWFTIIFRQILSSELNIFKRTDCDNFSFKINSELEHTKENLQLFKFIGVLMAKAMLENVTINTCFNMLLYKMLLNEKIHLEHILHYDQELFSSLSYIMKSKEKIDDLDIYFETPNQGDNENEELTSLGKEIKVSRSNIKEYLSKRIEYIQHRDKPFINEIKDGLFSVIPEHFIYVFNSSQLFNIINGKSEINISDWKSHTIYTEPYCEEYYSIKWFWDILSLLSQDDLSNFLLFCTGSSRTPITGFKELESNRGNISKFCINFVEYNKANTIGIQYIKAHTCFNRIDFPDYPKRDKLEEAIQFIINNEILGFGIE